MNRPFYWIVICTLAIIPLAAGIFTFQDYGESMDEGSLYVHSEYSLQAYGGILSHGLNSYSGKGLIRYYGPAFIMGANLFVRLANFLTNGILKTDAWHLAYFISFTACAWGFYHLSKRWLHAGAALSVSLLFLFQPLLWGHAFINPKDIPFMALFLGSIATGLSMLDKLFPTTAKWNAPRYEYVKQAWHVSDSSDRIKACLSLTVSIAFLVISFLGQEILYGGIIKLMETIYSLGPDNPLNRMFVHFAQNYGDIPVSFYAKKSLMIIVAVLNAASIGFLMLSLFFSKRIFPEALSFLNRKTFAQFCKETLTYLRSPSILLAGLVLGITVSVRPIGPLAGVILFLLAIRRGKSTALPAFLAYFIFATLVMYLTWPYLWPDPIGRFMESLTVMSEFPWEGKTLFHGVYYPSSQLPATYLPGLFALQFTEPAVLLFMIGFCIFAFRVWKRSVNPDYSLLVILWGVVPFLFFAISRPSLYDNFRQLLFIVPAFFLIMGLAFDKIHQRIGNPYIMALLTALFLLPGIWSIIHLHPYQYIYYNSFTGGVRGAFRQYESDYWCASFREGIEYVNQVAPQNARVIMYAGGSVEKIKRYARSNLEIVSGNQPPPETGTEPTYAIISTRADRDLKGFTDWKTIYVIERDNNILAVVKQNPLFKP